MGLFIYASTATRTDYIVLFALGALWGSSFGAIKIALHEVTPLTVMSVRILLAGAALLLLTFIRKTQLLRGAQNWIKIIWMAILGTLMPFYLCLLYTSPSPRDRG